MSTAFFNGECPNTELKEVKERKRDRRPRMTGEITKFLYAKAVISANKNSKNSLKVLQLSVKAPAAPCQSRDIMPQVSVDPFHCEDITFVMDIENVLSWEKHVQIADIPIGAVLLSLWGCIHHLLDCSERFVRTHHMTYNLSWIPAHHRHDIDAFPRFRAGLAFQEPVQLVQFYRLRRAESSALFHIIFCAPFLSNLPHWICSFPVFSQHRGR